MCFFGSGLLVYMRIIQGISRYLEIPWDYWSVLGFLLHPIDPKEIVYNFFYFSMIFPGNGSIDPNIGSCVRFHQAI